MSLELPSRPNRPTWFDMINELHSRCSQGAVLHMGEITDPCELPWISAGNNYFSLRKQLSIDQENRGVCSVW